LSRFSDPMVVGWGELLEKGRAYDRSHPGLWEARLNSRGPEDLAIIVYTSGTTGGAKGAMISHANLMVQALEGTRLTGQNEHDERLAYLPLCHAAERVLGAYYAIHAGTVSNFVESVDTLAENACEVQPTVFVGVPRVWEKLHSTVMLKLSDATWLQRWAYRIAIGVGERRAAARMAGEAPSWRLRVAGAAADFFILRNLRRMMGIDRCRSLVTGGAPTSPELVAWYLALGVPMLQCYGQTECSGVIALTDPARIKLDAVARPGVFNDVRIAPDGEILIRGPSVFMGYLNDAQATAETVRDGWLHTGDLGEFDVDGFLRITGRKKEILITAGGKNISPALLENELKFSPYIADAVVVGDRRKYVTCLVLIDYDNVVHFAQERGVPYTDFASLARSAEVRALLQGEIERVNEKLARVETIKKFRVIDRRLTAEDKEMTPTLKLKRKVVADTYAALIDEMYEDTTP
jgi:long-chain acyl-CoA synthetase